MDDTQTGERKPAAAQAATLLRPREAAAYLRTTVKALERWRGTGEGPPFIKLSHRTVLYARADLEAHVEASRRRSTAHRA